jgi:hypothetical protein
MTDQACDTGRTPPMPKGEYMGMHRHHDDEWFDEIIINAGRAKLHLTVAIRWKESELSGDEWRVSSHLLLQDDDRVLLERPFGSMKWAIQYTPHFVYDLASHMLDCRNATLIVKRKGIVLLDKQFETWGLAAIGLPWHLTIAGENGETKQFDDAEDKSFCCQPGCSNPPIVLYKMKKEQVSPQSSLMVDFQYPEFQSHRRWFCKKHKHRGDCGLEDADTNYELISENWNGQ